MGDAVAKTLDAAQAATEILAGQCFVWERGSEAMSPQLLVTTTEQPGPEGKGDSGDDAAPRDELAPLQTLDRDDHLLDSVGLEDLEVQQPGVLDRCLRLALAEHAVDRVAQEHLEAVDQAE